MRRALLNEMSGNPMMMQAMQMMGGELPVEDIIEADSTELAEAIDPIDPDDYIIETATPLSLSTNKTQKGSVVTLAWLCKSKSQKVFTICSNYLIEVPVEEEIVTELPFHDENIFISSRVANNMIMSQLPSYISDMMFSTDDIQHGKDFLVDAVSVGKNDSGKKYTFTVSNELFASFSYVDNYICDNITNNYEITVAVIAAAKEPEIPTELFSVEKIDSIISMAPTDKKSTSVAIVFRVSSEDKSETVLTPFDVGTKFNKSKFRGNTSKKLEQTYMNDGDQYLSTFIIVTRIKNIDKEYMIIKAKNKNNETKLFLIDAVVRQQLEDMVRDF